MCGLFAGSYSILFILLSHSLSRLKVIQVLLFLIVTNNFIYQHFLYLTLSLFKNNSCFNRRGHGVCFSIHATRVIRSSYSVMLGKTLYIHRTLYRPIAAPNHCEAFYYQ